MKRLLDIFVSFTGLTIFSPILLVVCLLVWKQDFQSPFYIAPRVGKDGQIFKMVKLRSMVVNADKSGVESTSSSDTRITPIGKFIRSYKLDELTQLWNVLKGDMSLVGPRPQTQAGVDVYTEMERHLLDIRPGITDISSIVFADEGEILKNSSNPDLDYDILIRPWKSRLGLLYVNKHSLILDLQLVLITVATILNRESALNNLSKVVKNITTDEDLQQIVRRNQELKPCFPSTNGQLIT
jgi:lipopolysaccharide/colanic/teichoic acid biosynthesis glycosyltransferase